MLCLDAPYNLAGTEGSMAGRSECRYEPSLEDLLVDDEVMAPVLKSAGFDSQGLRDMLAETARRIDARRIDERPTHDRSPLWVHRRER